MVSMPVGAPVVFHDRLGVELGHVAAGPDWPRPSGRRLLFRNATTGEFSPVAPEQLLLLGTVPDVAKCWITSQ